MPFIRPLNEIERLISERYINERVVVQSGSTRFKSEFMELVPFFHPDELESLYMEASFVICQAGVGSIMLGLRNEKKLIVIARDSKFNEHIDDHQREILELFANQNLVLEWRGDGDLIEVLQKLPQFKPDKYVFGNENISNSIINYIDTYLK